MIKGFGDFKTSTPGEISEYYRTKSISQLSLEELANIHLDINSAWQCLENGNISSNIYDLNETVAAGFNNNRTKQYVPLLACFSILDQIGSAYERTDQTSAYGNGIKKALDLYSNFKLNQDLEFLVTLRHGLFHDGSLTYINKSTGTKVFFRMIMGSGKLLTPSIKPWDGVYYDDLSDYITYIDLKELHVKTKEVITECRRLLLNGKIKIMVAAPRELFYKYLFVVKSGC